MKDFIGYINRMQNALSEKLFFLNQIDLNSYSYMFDFGCADGFLIKNLAKSFANTKFVGYDYNVKMIEKANSNKPVNATFTNVWDELQNLSNSSEKKAILFSSVLHEIPYSSYDQILSLIKNFDCIIIRDMYFDHSKNIKLDCQKYLKNQFITQKIIDDYEKNHAKIDDLKNLYHLFLKYTYLDNWETEIKENYFGINYKKLAAGFIKSGFRSFYDYPYTLPFKKQEILKNFNYNLVLPTHRNLIFIK